MSSSLQVAVRRVLRSPQREFRLDAAFETSADITILFGPSGAGKTLTLLSIAGLQRPDAGTVRFAGRLLFDSAQRIDVPARERRIGYVFQDYALFPHLTVAQNVAFARRRGWVGSRRGDPASRTLLDAFELGPCAAAYPAQLSGGQRQRVALARALATEPQLLLLDEPFAALDAPLRTRLRNALCTLQRERGVPMIVITHDPDDVAALGGAVIRLDAGSVVGGRET